MTADGHEFDTFLEYDKAYIEAGITLTASEYAKMTIANQYNISIDKWIAFRSATRTWLKKEVCDYINLMSITRGQKDALYRLSGYAESTLAEMPWNKKETPPKPPPLKLK
jgi:hypothetical protein